MDKNPPSRVCIAVTGASGSLYAESLISLIRRRLKRIYLCASNAGLQVMQHELSKEISTSEFSLLRVFNGDIESEDKQVFRIFKNDDLFAPIASGSSVPDAMVIVPCSMGTLARIANGLSSNLIERAADVVLKEKKKLIIVPRESPLNEIHLENMLKLARIGAHMIPPMPAFYQNPKSIDELVLFTGHRILDALGLSIEDSPRWNSRMS